jgi:hypothetical protein
MITKSTGKKVLDDIITYSVLKYGCRLTSKVLAKLILFSGSISFGKVSEICM